MDCGCCWALLPVGAGSARQGCEREMTRAGGRMHASALPDSLALSPISDYSPLVLKAMIGPLFRNF